MSLTSSELQDILAFATQVARSAGDLILQGSKAILSSGTVDEKKNAVDLVTEYDVKVEELVKKELRSKYPDFKFIGEESYYAGGSKTLLTDEPTFCVDPIDGTTNFVHGFPHVAVSIGLIQNQRPVLGVIYNPFLDLLYTGVKGQGSYLSARGKAPVKLPIAKPKPLESLSKGLLAVEWGYDRSGSAIQAKGESFKRLAGNPNEGVQGGKMAHSLRSLGSAALNFALVAQGGLDLYWEHGTSPWDITAGVIIAQEAGGFVAGARNLPLDNDVNGEVLFGKKHIVVRAIGDTKDEKGVDAQKRIIKDLFDTVEDFTPA